MKKASLPFTALKMPHSHTPMDDSPQAFITCLAELLNEEDGEAQQDALYKRMMAQVAP
jgi:hypothetical protein